MEANQRHPPEGEPEEPSGGGRERVGAGGLKEEKSRREGMRVANRGREEREKEKQTQEPSR